MKLLVFAHRAEAQAFLQKDQYVPIAFHFSGLFFSEEAHTFLLITGEGNKEASEKTVAVLAVYKEKINQVINIGIAGSLSPKLKRNDLIWVRSSYAHSSKKIEFKSFTTTHHTKIDCLTSFHRVTDPKEKEELAAFADIVDRELWSVLSACHLFKIEGLGLKVISDEVEETDFCEIVKSEAQLYSNLLLEEWLRFLNLTKPLAPTFPAQNAFNQIKEHRAFHFTLTQQRQLEALFRSLKLKDIFIDDNDLISYCEDFNLKNENQGTPKDLSRKLLISLDELNNPLKFKIKNKIKEALMPLTEAGISVHTDPDLESSHVQLSMTLHTLRDQKKLQLALEQFQMQKIKDIFNGQIENDVKDDV